MIGNMYDYSLLPPEPNDLTTAVKDYRAWLADNTKPLTGGVFDTLKYRIVQKAVDLVGSGKLEDL